jgi:hypothetical protein
LRKYIDENLAKSYIRALKSLTIYPILFVPKKNEKLRIYVDYRKLNEMTIKNHYTLPLIYEMQDRIRETKYFTRLNLREAYYKIQIKEEEE